MLGGIGHGEHRRARKLDCWVRWSRSCYPMEVMYRPDECHCIGILLHLVAVVEMKARLQRTKEDDPFVLKAGL